MADVPVIDVSALRGGGAARDEVARRLDAACREVGFFYIVGHDVPEGLQRQLEALSREFFGLPEDEKARIGMAGGGRAWRGWFPVGGELTSGMPDRKEGIYFGAELDPEHPRVAAGVPLHGPNLFPAHPADLRDTVLAYMAAMTDLGHLLSGAVARALGLADDWFATHLTADPTVLFRIFHYPPGPAAGAGEEPAADRGGVWPSTPTTACSRSFVRTTRAGWRCGRPRVGPAHRRSPGRSSATWATCSSA